MLPGVLYYSILLAVKRSDATAVPTKLSTETNVYAVFVYITIYTECFGEHRTEEEEKRIAGLATLHMG